jgi:hypothetical protein
VLKLPKIRLFKRAKQESNKKATRKQQKNPIVYNKKKGSKQKKATV